MGGELLMDFLSLDLLRYLKYFIQWQSKKSDFVFKKVSC